MKISALTSAIALGLGLAGASAVALADDQAITGSGPSFTLGNAKLTVGGFIAAESVYRNHDQVADVASKFQAIPLRGSDAYYLSDFRMTARQSRLSLLVQGPEINGGKAEAYYEGDFLGAAVTANSTESNSYTPRIRQIFTDYTTDGGFQILAGQAWSLVTQNKSGIVARKENAPMTIEAQYVPGFSWTRNPQLRLTQKFSNALTAAVSIESPQAIPANAKSNGITVVTTQAGGANMNSSQYTVDGLPDAIAKVAVDPGFGHYEVIGMMRNFRDRVDPGTGAAAKPANGGNSRESASSFGANFILPVVPKIVDFQASILTGDGVGRYGSSQLADYTTNHLGEISSIKSTQVLFGLVAHPTPVVDLYAYAGEEKADRNDLGGGYGYGSQVGTNNATCTAFSNSGAACNLEKVAQVTVGGWYKFYQGDMGYMQTGLQVSHTTADSFTDANGIAAKTSMNTVLASFRYYPFQK